MKKIFLIISIIVLILISIIVIIWDHTPLAIVSIDNDGIPWVDYGSIDDTVIGKKRNPVTISQKSFSYYNDFQSTGNETAKQYLLNNADWLLANSKSYGNYSIIEYDFPYPPYDMPSSWRSGMAQGQVLQALIKAHEVSQNIKYLQGAKLILNSFFVEVKEGGVTYKTKDHGWWFEEYAHENVKPSRVLNGMMYTVLGIHDFYKYTNDTNAKFLIDQGVLSLKNNLPNYNLNRYSYYDNLKHPSPSSYHLVHIEQTKSLYEITEEEVFLKYHDIWKNCDSICQFIERNLAKLQSRLYDLV